MPTKSKNNIRNQELFGTAREFLRKALSLVASEIDQATKTIEKKHKISGDNSYTTRFINRPMFEGILVRREEELQQLPEFHNCQLLMQNDHNFSKHLGRNVGLSLAGGARRDTWSFLSHILVKLLYSYQERKNFNGNLFSKMYKDLEKFVDEDTISSLIIAPLLNFDSDAENFVEGYYCNETLQVGCCRLFHYHHAIIIGSSNVGF